MTKMPKRGASNELNHDNWNEEEEPEEVGEFKLASADTMSKRIIKTGKRRLGSAGASPSISPFAKFNFGSGTAGGTTPSTGFSFLTQSKPSNSDKSSSSVDNSDAKKDEPAVTTNKDAANNQYLGKLKGLNEEFLTWVETHVKKNASCILTPVFEDYNKYLKEIQSEKDRGQQKVTSSNTITPFSGFKFNVAPPTNSSPLKSIGFSSNATITPAASPKDKSPEKPLGGGIFGNTAGSPFSFGAVKPFTFGNSVAAAQTTSPLSSAPDASKGDGDGETSDEPPKNDFTPVTESDAVLSQRVKVFVKKDGENYADKGVGTLFIKPANNKYQAVVRADTSLGNVLLNIILSESMPIKRMGNNHVLLVCVPVPGQPDPKPVPTLLKVKTKEDADKLFDELNKYKK